MSHDRDISVSSSHSPCPCYQEKERCVYSSMLDTCMVMEVLASTLYIVRMHQHFCGAVCTELRNESS